MKKTILILFVFISFYGYSQELNKLKVKTKLEVVETFELADISAVGISSDGDTLATMPSVRAEIEDSLTNYINRTELVDTLERYADTNFVQNQIHDSLSVFESSQWTDITGGISYDNNVTIGDTAKVSDISISGEIIPENTNLNSIPDYVITQDTTNKETTISGVSYVETVPMLDIVDTLELFTFDSLTVNKIILGDSSGIAISSNNDTLATTPFVRNYVLNNSPIPSAAGLTSEIQFNTGGVLDASEDLSWDGYVLKLGGGKISSGVSNNDHNNGFYLNTDNTLTTAISLLRVLNNGVVKLDLSPSGDLEIAGDLEVSGMISQDSTWELFGGFQDSTVLVDLTENVYSQVTNDYGTLWTGLVSDGFIMSGDTSQFINGGDYAGAFSVTFTGTSGIVYQFRVWNITQNKQEGFLIAETGNGSTDYTTITKPLRFVDITAGDKLILQVTNINNDNDITFRYGSYDIKYIHD